MSFTAMEESTQPNKSCADWNNHGVSLLCSGMYDEAVLAFRSALSKISTCSFVNHDGVGTQGSSSLLDFHVHEIDGLGRTSMSDHNTLILHASAFLFSRIQAQEEAMDRGSGQLATIVSGVLLFNLALANHLLTLSNFTRGNDLLRVQKIYRVAEEVLHQVGIGSMNSSQRRVLLAINNNNAHISFHFFHLEASANALSTMGALLNGYGIDEERDKHFLLNILCSGKFVMTSPAA